MFTFARSRTVFSGRSRRRSCGCCPFPGGLISVCGAVVECGVSSPNKNDECQECLTTFGALMFRCLLLSRLCSLLWLEAGGGGPSLTGSFDCFLSGCQNFGERRQF